MTSRLPYVISIDPSGAKEIDDAIGVKMTESGWLLDVCIPDVPLLLAYNSKEDLEARQRGLTLYAANNVRQSMLPTELVEKLSLSNRDDRPMIHVTIGIEGNLSASVVTIERIKHRTAAQLTYAEADEILETGQSWHYATMEALWDLTIRLQQERSARTGAVFDLEKGVITDEEGRLIRLDADRKHKSNLIVMEMMILANETLARHSRETFRPVLYRNHVLEGFERGDRETAAYDLAMKERIGTAVALQRVRNLQSLVRQAELGTQSKGHYGLDTKDYAWFTSPLRRYVDVHNLRTLVSSTQDNEEPDYDADIVKLEQMATRFTGLYRQKAEESAEHHARTSRRNLVQWLDSGENRKQLDKSQIHTIIRALGENPAHNKTKAFDYLKKRMARNDMSGRDILSLLEEGEALFGSPAAEEIAIWAKAPQRKELVARHIKTANLENAALALVIDEQTTQEFIAANDKSNHKGKLLELAATANAKVTFSKAERSGPSHEPVFTVDVTWEGETLLKATRSGLTVKSAEQAAAAEVLGKIGSIAIRDEPVKVNQHPKNTLLEKAAKDSTLKVNFGNAVASGPPHSPIFTVEVSAIKNGQTITRKGTGKNRKDAERSACESVLAELRAPKKVKTHHYRKRRDSFVEDEEQRL